MQQKRRKWILYSALLAGIVAILFNHQRLLVWAQSVNPDSEVLPTILKKHVTQEDIVTFKKEGNEAVATKANVLFLVDVGSAMLFTPQGKLPDWLAEYNKATGGAAQRTDKANAITAAQMAQCTFGGGGLPNAAYSTRNKRDGRDLDTTNNDRNNPDHYYNTGVLGYPPNDSRMYQMKLVLWRMLDDADLFGKFRFALATTYQEEIRLQAAFADFYRAPEYDRNATFPYGQGPAWATGGSSITSSQYVEWGIDVSMFDDASPSNRYPNSNWFQVNRAFLHVPFGEVTSQDTRHISVFRTLINGVENSSKTNPSPYGFQMNEPELLADGRTQLSTAIFPGVKNGNAVTHLRDQFLSRNLIYFSNYNSVYSRSFSTSSGGFHSLGKGSGEALGSVLDFFSPPVKDKGASADGVNVLSSVAGNFPIRNACDPNWLVVFTAGDDSAAYSGPEAVKDLYEYTRDNDVVILSDDQKASAIPPSTPINSSRFKLGKVRLNDPIRTMVIGFVDETKANSDPDIKKLVNTLNDMADYGLDGKKDGNGRAYFANDVPGLLKAMREILNVITAEVPTRAIAASSPMMSLSGLDAEGFQIAFEASSRDQWPGILKQFNIISHEVYHTLDAAKHLNDSGATSPSGRNIYSFNFNNNTIQKLSYPAQLGTNTAYTFFRNSFFSKPMMNPFDQDATFAPTLNKNDAATLMARWLFGEDYDLEKKKFFPRKAVLPDMGVGGYTLMRPGVPEERVHAQPGYAQWAQTPAIVSRPDTLFFQSNEGLLHALDVRNPSQSKGAWQREHWTFIPPNVLVGQRLLGLKFDFKQKEMRPGNKEYRRTATWVNSTYSDVSSDRVNRSNAAYMTDGAVYLYNLPYYDSDKFNSAIVASPDWKTVLVASTGRGGAGLYAMDVTTPTTLNNESFLWAVENNLSLYNTVRVPPSGKGSPHWGEVHTWQKSFIQADKYAVQRYDDAGTDRATFDRLGFNVPAPLVGTTRSNFGYSYFERGGSGWGGTHTVASISDLPTPIAVIAGGMQYDLNLNENGLFGSAIYIVDPLGMGYKASDSTHLRNPLTVLRSFTNDDAASTIVNYDKNAEQGKTPNPILGMVITPPAAITELADTRYLAGFVTADNRGQIFEGRFMTSDDKKPLGTDGWELRRVATLRKPTAEKGAYDNFPIPYPLSVAGIKNKDDIWFWGGTADVLTRNIGENLFAQSPRAGIIARKTGEEHYLFGFKRSLDVAIELRSDTHAQPLGATLRDQSIDIKVHQGWIIPLQKATSTHQREYLSGKTLLESEQGLFAPTFVPTHPIKEELQVACFTTDVDVVNGMSRLYRLNPVTGASKWLSTQTSRKYMEYEGIKMAGLNILTQNGEPRIYISISIVDQKRFAPFVANLRDGHGVRLAFDDSPDYEKSDAKLHNQNLMSIGLERMGSRSSGKLPAKDATKLLYWREIFSR